MRGGMGDELWGPRDAATAQWAATIIGCGCAVMCVAFEALGPALDRPSSTPLTLACALVFAVTILSAIRALHRNPGAVPVWLWVAMPVIGLLCMLALNLIAAEPGAAGQVGLLYSVVFAAAHLRRAAVWTVCGMAVACAALIASSRLGPGDAIAEVLAVGGVIVFVTVLLERLTARQQALTERLAELASVDTLTGLATRRELERAATIALGVHQRRLRDAHLDRGVALLMIDLDDFKGLNDAHGHLVGDAALVHVAALLRDHVRRPSTIARIGGDEVAVLLPDCTDEEAERVAEQTLEAILDAPLREDGRLVPLSASIGVAHLDRAEPGASQAPRLADLYAAADVALYRAKVAGRGRVEVHAR